MKRTDLKSGMVINLRDWKEKFILIDDTFCSYEGKNFLKIGNYDEKLNFKNDNKLDIVKVYKCKYPNLLKCLIEDKLELVWKREEVEKEITHKELDNIASKFCEENRGYGCKEKGCGPCAVKFISDSFKITRK